MKEGIEMEVFSTETNRYKVLDVRETLGDTNKPIVLICKDYTSVTRRRIEVWNFDGWSDAYEVAKMLVPGDIILVHESYNRNGNGKHVIEEIEY